MEAGWFKSGRHRGSLTGELQGLVCLSFCRRDVTNRFEEPLVVEPGHTFKRREFHCLLGLPGRLTMDQLSLVEAIDGLGQRVVAVPFAAVNSGSKHSRRPQG